MAKNLGNPAFVLITTMLLLAAGAFTLGVSAAKVYLQKLPVEPPFAVASMPAQSDSWERLGEDRLESAEVVETLGTENYLNRLLAQREETASEGEPRHTVDFHLAYYTGMIDTVPHVPERCFVGGGMQVGASPVVVPIPLDLGDRSMLRSERDNPLLLGSRTPEELMPVVREDGRRDVYWIRLDSQHSNAPGEYVRVPFDPSQLKMRVTRFAGPNERPVFAGYFFIANGGVTDSANAVRQLAFRLEDRYAYYLKVQFTSSSVGSPEQLAELAASILDEQLGEVLRCTPDWIELKQEMIAGEPSDADGEQESA